ncbi:iron-sulfur cluster assembly accessory protein [Candidatus Cyanaurora vandensis]|uniref:HesB/IscA family protein n=1 Tax=Candidatus Cyanaurora vandensis TaxID=2714958 RepID=UPI00257DDA6E|nr:iron-sulfur cluster assembly accessory protein [Candidatus Cyanaurora vandensis]
MITVTDTALDQFRRLRRKKNDEELMLRLGVKNAGCSGMSYDIKPERTIGTTDQVYEYGDVKVLVDTASLTYLDDLTLDYSADLMGGGFRFRNPNATHTCGCGSSFSTTPPAP